MSQLPKLRLVLDRAVECETNRNIRQVSEVLCHIVVEVDDQEQLFHRFLVFLLLEFDFLEVFFADDDELDGSRDRDGVLCLRFPDMLGGLVDILGAVE